MYQVKILSSKEFDEVAKSNPRYKHVDRDNLGFADPAENVAYVRHTAWPDLNKYLITHEFEHLVEDHGTDEDDMGIRHKKKRGFTDWFTGLSTAGLWHPSSDNTANKNQERDEAQAQEQAMQQMMSPQQVAQSYQDSFGTTANQFGAIPGSSQGSAAAPSSIQGDSIGGSLYQGGLNPDQDPNADPELQKRIKGFFSGRVPF